MWRGIRRAAVVAVLGGSLAGCAGTEEKQPEPTMQPMAPAGIEGLPKAVAVGNVVLSDQPTPALLSDLRHLGFARVVNLRPNSEMSFDESVLVRAAGLEYVSIPVTLSQLGDDEITLFLGEVRSAAKEKQKLLVHCSSGNRAAAMWAIYEITDLDVPADVAVQRARQAGMTSPELIGIIGQHARRIGKF